MGTFSESDDLVNSSQSFGRNDAWTTLFASINNPKRQLTYVWGPSGIGKTFFLQQFADSWRVNGHAIVWSSFRQDAPTDLQWWQQLALQFDLDPFIATLDTLKEAMIGRCRAERFVWVVDDCDSPQINRGWVVQVALGFTASGGYTILTGRTPPFQLWSGSNKQKHLQSLELSEWNADVVQCLLSLRGIRGPSVLQHAIRLTHGRPKLVSAVVDGMLWLQENQVPAAYGNFMADEMDLSGFLLEQICHPGSQRLMWNAGRSGDLVDTMIAASAVVPIFNRDWLIQMVGRSVVTEAWDRFIALPIVNSYLGGYYGLFSELRQEIMVIVHKIRPWRWEHWVRQAAAYYLRQIATGRVAKPHAWGALFELIRTDLGSPVFGPDLNMTALEMKPDRSADSPNDRILVYVNDLAGNMMASVVRTVKDLHTCHVTDVTVDAEYPDALIGLMGALASTFYLYDHIVWDAPQSETEMRILQVLQFTQLGQKWHLDISGIHFMEWLTSMVAAPKGRRPANPVRVVQDLLQGIREGNEHYGPEATEFWTSISPDGNFRAWFLDALNSADLGEAVNGKSLLVLYYLDQRGTHEELAEMVHVSRSTYFRNHRIALERLAEAVFD